MNVRLRRAWTVLATSGALGCGPDVAPEVSGRFDPAAALSGAPDSGFARVTGPRPFVFPRDHGPHDDFRTEWWYVTANLRTEAGNEFGLQFTVFRSALAPPSTDLDPAPLDSPWRTRQAFMAHFALTDVGAQSHRSFERFARGAAGLAGARTSPDFRVWLDQWELRSQGPIRSGPDGIFPLVLKAADSAVAVDLVLERGRPLVLQGEEGFSRKGSQEGQASYYYSFPSMLVRGSVRTPRGAEAVTGVAWMDREWSTSVLDSDQEGWDWFALHLPDGRDLMVFELRSRTGASRIDGTLMETDGTVRRLSPTAVRLQVLDEWASPLDDARYPSGWRLALGGEDVDVTILPLVPDQELRHGFRYWEGAVRVTDLAGGEGRGYAELTGYAGPPLQR